MAIAAVPEAAGAAEAAGGGVAAARGGIRPSSIPAKNRPPWPEPEERPARASARPRRPARPAAAAQQEQDRKQPEKRSRKRKGPGFLDRPKGRNYQPIILAEFLVAVLVVAVVPVAKGGSADAKAKGSPSPYSVGDVKQLVAIGGVYFVLALVSGSKKYGRMAAWFGALVLAALGLVQSKDGGIKALFSVFGPGGGVTAPGVPAQIQQSAEGALGFLPTPGQPTPVGTNAPTGTSSLNPASIFPTVEPGGTIVPAINLTDSGQVSSITVPAGQAGVITNANTAGTNLA